MDLLPLEGLVAGTLNCSFVPDAQSLALLKEEMHKIEDEIRKAKRRTLRKQKTVNQNADVVQAARLMRKAAEVLRDRPWTKGTIYRAETKGMCMLGALNFAACGNPQPWNQNKLVNVANDAFAKWNGVLSIPKFNDAKDTTKEDVIQAMFKFADEFDPKGAKHG